MKFRCILAGLFFSIILLSPVAADNDTNDSYSNAEVIGEGTYTGKVDVYDEDWYKVEGMGDREVTITAKLTSGGTWDNLEVLSCGEYGVEDGQTQIYLGEWEREDHCQWEDPGDKELLYFYIQGEGEYELKIEFEGSSSASSSGGGSAPWTWALIGTCGVVSLFMTLLFIVMIVLWGKRKQ